MAYCSQCGASIPDGAKFCPNCGAAVTVADPNAGSAPYGQEKSFYAENPNPQYGGDGNASFYGNDPYHSNANAPYGGGLRASIRKRDIATAIVLSIVTCGIYAIIWLYNIINDLNASLRGPNDKDAGTVILLMIVTCGIYGLIWVYHAGEKIDQIKQMNGEPPSNSAVLYLVLAFVGLSIVTQCLIQSELNKIALYE
ncbi:MAG: DUF4234 domain-containing protein [Clostridia bacterium]|nr:DUF4234 domain-containing protein [Clostridia bacterium]